MHRHSWLFNFCFWSALALCSQAAFSAEDKGKKDPKVEDKPAAVADDKLKWGNLSATFIYDGEPPEPRELKIDKDREFYKDPIYDASLLVDEKSKGIANVVTWLYVRSGEKPPPIHASYAELAKQDAVLDTIKGQFEPHVCLLWTPQTLHYKNSEPIGHNQKGDFFANPAWGELTPASGSFKKKMTKQESRPMPLACNIHPWESGWMLIRDNPYMAVSKPNGKLQIKNLPAGTHTFVLWHELAGYIQEAKRDGKKQVIDKGRLTVDIKPGDNDLGEFVIKPAPR